jgi:uncharacterized protein YdhG (YjbR/CyaY superfamily)
MKARQGGAAAVDAYIEGFAADTQARLRTMRSALRRAAPDAGEKIAYGIPTFTLNGNLVHFAAFEKHLGFYPTPSAILAFREELTPYAFAKGSVRFPLDRPLPLGLIGRMVRFRVREVLARQARGRRPAATGP